jgi:multidrug resistance efflux pump
LRCKRCRRGIDSREARLSAFVHCVHCNFTFRPDEAPASQPELALRSDLVITPVTPDDESGALHYVIKDPRSNRYFKVKPLEHFLITQFDGNTSLETIRRRASESENVLVSEDVLSRFAEKFRELGLLVRSGDDPPAGRSDGPSFAADVLHWKRPLANPERLLDWLYPKARFGFTAPFVWLMSLTILAAAAVAVLNLDELAFGLEAVVSLEGLLFVLVTVSAVTALHELAHGLTCRHFGGRVTDMGFLLLYFLPCFYCNVGDTYLFREKRQRLWVFFSGGFFELFVWAVAVLGFRLLFPGTFASRVLFVVAAVCAIRSLFNFNPLIKMDGYFLLSEVLGISNLRREAFRGFGRLVRRVSRLEAEPVPAALSTRRIAGIRGDRFLALFGGAALAYTALLVGALVTYSGGFLFESYGADGLAFFTVALVGLLHKPALTAASAAKEVGQEKWQQLTERRKRSRFVLLWLVLALVAAFFPWELRIASNLQVLPQEREIVRAPSKGRIARIHAVEGGRVAAGDLILEYDATELVLERRTKEAELAQATEELRLLGKENPTVREEITVKQRALEVARAQEDAAQREFERSRELWTLGLVSKESFDKAENELESTLARRREAEAEIALVQKSSPESRNQQMEMLHLRDPGAQQAIIQKLEAELARLDDLLERTKIYASVSGTLTTYRFEEKVGDYLEEGAEVCEIANDDRVVLEMPVAEKDIDVIEKGQAVKFKVRGYPTRSFHARVDEIAPVATRDDVSGKSSTILVRAFVDNDDKVLKPGMTGVAKIYCGMSFVANIFTRDLVRFVRTEFWL